MNTERHKIAAGIDHGVALAALDLLVGIVSGNGRVFNCFTFGLSITPAVVGQQSLTCPPITEPI